MATAQVHRFRDKVAAYLANGATVYLTPTEADALGDALKRAAASCRNEPFAKSTFGTFTIELEAE
jgi:hypothetical protein